MRRTLGTALTLLVAAAACGRRPASLSLDLARVAAAAERVGPRQVILFGTPAAQPHQAEGFLLPAEPGLERFAWSRPRAELRLDWPEAIARRALVELAPYSGLPEQAAEVFLNGTSVGRIELGRGRSRHLLTLPAAAQRAHNTLRFAFQERSARVEDYGRRLAAAFYSLTIADASDAGLAALAHAEAPQPLAVELGDGVPRLVQGGSSGLRYAVRVPGAAELRLRPGLHSASQGPARLRVTLERDGAARELWRDRLSPGERTGELALRIPGAGSLARLGLHVESESEAAPVWATWDAPRLLGDAPALALPSEPTREADQRKADTLRRQLSEANVVLIVLDAAGAKHFGCYGYGRATTPEIDRIAAEGVLFERAYTPAVYTLAAMSSVWTSQYPDEHGNVELRNASLDRVRLTLAELLSARGVRTAGFVANGMAGPAFSFDRGFGEFQEIYGEQGSRAEGFRQVLPDWFGARAGERFFAYVHYREPHAPYDPPPPFRTLFGPDAPLTNADPRRLMVQHSEGKLDAAGAAHLLRLYDGNLAYVDREVGFLRRTLESAGLWERSVVIVTADHGEELLEHGWIGHNTQLFDESTRVPLIMRLPEGRGPRGLRLAGLVDLVDLAPTIADILGAREAAGTVREFRGRSLLPLLFGAPGKTALPLRSSGGRPRYALRDERFKLIHDSATGSDQLYDLSVDVDERRDLAPAERMRADYFRLSLHAWLLGLERLEPSEKETQLTPRQLENLRALGYIE